MTRAAATPASIPVGIGAVAAENSKRLRAIAIEVAGANGLPTVFHGGTPHDDTDDNSTRANRRTGTLLSAAGIPGFWRSGRAGRPDGARTGRRAQMADQGADARGHRDLPVPAGAARDPGRDLHFLSARRLLGRLGRRLGLHPAELRHRRRAGRALCLSRRPQAGHRDLLWRQPRRHRADPAFLLPAGQARHGRLAAMGDRRGLPRRHRHPAGRSGAAVHRRGHRRHSLLRQPVQANAAGALDSRGAGARAARARPPRARSWASSCCSSSRPARSPLAAAS